MIGGMTTDEALIYFDKSRVKLAAALGIEPESTYDWKEYPPELRQLQLEVLTNGKLKAEPPKKGPAVRVQQAA